jgi:hypothetical protein
MLGSRRGRFSNLAKLISGQFAGPIVLSEEDERRRHPNALRLPRGVLFQSSKQILNVDICLHKREPVTDNSLNHLPKLLLYLALFVKQPRPITRFGTKVAKMHGHRRWDERVEGLIAQLRHQSLQLLIAEAHDWIEFKRSVLSMNRSVQPEPTNLIVAKYPCVNAFFATGQPHAGKVHIGLRAHPVN